MFKEMLIKQFERNAERYEIEKVDIYEVEVWDRVEKRTLCFYFDEEGNLKEIW